MRKQPEASKLSMFGWHKHLKPFGKRLVNKAVRRFYKKLLNQ